MLAAEQRYRLVAVARAAAARAFLTSPGGTAYGAAVFTASGNTYQAGQYSSFNHVSNVHAEQAALVQATMADDPDVLALAVASTGSEPVTRPCGVCRQVLTEHVVRVGRDFEVLMACRHGDGYEVARVTELLPFGWTPGQYPRVERTPDIRYALPQPGCFLGGEPLQSGDHVTLADGCVGEVCDGEFEPGGILVKPKYAPADGGLRKLAHSFAEPLLYQKELHDLAWTRPAQCGIRLPVIRASDISGLFKSLPLGAEVGEPPGPLMGILGDAGVDVAAIRVAGSRAIGLQPADANWDLVVPVEVKRLPAVREKLAAAVEKGMLAVPPSSTTWGLLDRILPGGRLAALRCRRFADTLLSGGVSVALMFVPPELMGVCVGPD